MLAGAGCLRFEQAVHQNFTKQEPGGFGAVLCATPVSSTDIAEVQMSFQIHALAQEKFAHLFTMTDEELGRIGALRVMADQHPGMPCRVSLQEAEVGDELILMNHVSMPETSPYRTTHAIYVRKGVAEAALGGAMPESW
jgi:hypothetical protein